MVKSGYAENYIIVFIFFNPTSILMYFSGYLKKMLAKWS